MKRIAVDIGGTFTDCFVCWGDEFIQTKALTTHHNLALGFNDALDQSCEMLKLSRSDMLAEVDSVRYATTLGTNALIERRGPKVGLLITEGFESTVPLSRGRGYGDGLPDEQARDLSRARRPDPIVPIASIRTVKQRMDYRGKILLDLDEADVREKLKQLVDRGVQAIVVNMINSVENPEHELRVQEIFEEEFPSSMLGAIPMVLSHQVVGRKGEYVRSSSAIIDAFLHSTMYYAMSALEQNLRTNGYGKPMLLVHNSGGMAQLNSTDALKTLHSGPVAGIHAAEQLALQSGTKNFVCGDMGGTSFDIGLITEGGTKHYDFNPVVDRWRVTLPMVHLVTLGAGGGSIAKYDAIFDTVKVGPQSAGSDPGPACYDRGGMNPTVTDADLVLGYLDPDNYANGAIPLNKRRSYQALEDICDEMDISEQDAALLIKSMADSEMAAGLVRELNGGGYKAEEFIFLAYGGNGPLHCCGIADKAGITEILAPPYSSVFSACGGAGLDQMHIHEKNVSLGFYNKHLRALYSDYQRFNELVEELEQRGRDDLLRQGFHDEDIKYSLELDMRYGIQKMEVSIELPNRRLTKPADVLNAIEAMNDDFGKRYGHEIVSPESGVWVTTVRVVSRVDLGTVTFSELVPPAPLPVQPDPVAFRECYFNSGDGKGSDGAMETPVYGAAALEPGVCIEGPAIVNPGSTTYLVEPGWTFKAAAQGAVWFSKAK
ncbi:hydantoinase/oxoprolinase family protein [Spongiibacter nanhainus]|uniref:Hydantoinase/oxoprolinase family protein n=1 Tax=Spongiibacter nanhainus TaxID=2794344 RepID=A0A7T4R096_9GAMM|nr:hydantoinase/oxoprolinase family protein [Spongiibacter nanhainus]QQD17939.1 hydantoinase/oxoprolinase family protein [Spongiibacter nanhainus]